MRWTISPAGKKMPVDAQPIAPDDLPAKGAVYHLVERAGETHAVKGIGAHGEPLYVSHFLTCEALK